MCGEGKREKPYPRMRGTHMPRVQKVTQVGMLRLCQWRCCCWLSCRRLRWWWVVTGMLRVRMEMMEVVMWQSWWCEKRKWSRSVVPTLCCLIDCSLPGSSIHGIFQARVPEWVAISFSRGSSQPRDWTWVSHIAGRRFTLWATREVMVWYW